MLARNPDAVTRRIAVVLGTRGSGQQLLHVLQPLLGEETETDLRGVFIEDDELQQAAALPFVKEVCRLTLGVREIHSARLERIVALRTRTARKAVAGLARRMGVAHSFLNLRGSTVSLLRETAHSADITVFEPQPMFVAAPVLSPLWSSRPQQRIVVAVDDPATGVRALVTAALLAEGDMHRISVLLIASTRGEQAALERMISDLLPATPASIVLLSKPGVKNLIAAARAEDTGMLVLGTSEEILKPESLRSLLEQVSCPVCLVRRWDNKPIDPE